jgi:DNA primase
LAPFFSQEKLSEIRFRADIVEIISEYVSLKKAGKNFLGLCPFHSEKTPSFNVNQEKQAFYCFGCQKGGDVITFLREIHSSTFVEAVNQLAGRYGITVSPSPHEQEKGDGKEVLLGINDRVASYFHRLLTESPEGKKGRDYLEDRGIDAQVWGVFKLGYAPDSWDGLVRNLSSANISLPLAQSLGLIAPRKGGGFFDCFRGRIVFPIFNLNGRTAGFGGRAITGGLPKYLNSSDSIIYKKRFSLFGLPMVRNAIRQEDRVFIVEGYFDLLRMYQSGLCSVVSPLGTALTSGHIQALKRFTSNVYIVFDADEAGVKAALRSLELFLDEGIAPRIVLLPTGTDPDDLIQKKGVEEFLKRIEAAPHLLDYYVDRTIQDTGTSSPEGKVEVLKAVMPIINRIGQPIVQDDCIRKLTERLEVKEDHVRSFSKPPSPSQAEEAPSHINEYRPEEFLLALMLQKSEAIEIADKARVIEDFGNPSYKDIGKVIIEAYRNTGKADLIDVVDALGERERNVAAALSLREENFGNLLESLKDCIHQIKKNRIRRMQANLTQRIKKAQESRDEVEIRDLHKRKIELILQEKNLNSNIGSLVTL